MCAHQNSSMNTQPVTLEQLARLYEARNAANKRMSQAMRVGDKTLITLAVQESSSFNKAYDAARKAYKKQQKTKRKADLRTTMIRWYLDQQQDQTPATGPTAECGDSVLLLQR